MVRVSLAGLLLAPPLTGPLAVLCGFYLVALPTGIRWAINGSVTGCEFTPYLPFVLISAVLMRPWQASAVALASVGILGNLFVGPLNVVLANECFLSSSGIFLASSLGIIGIVVLTRRVFVAMQNRGADEAPGGIVYSLEQGQVWASWYGQGPPILLGSQPKVSKMMHDFLRQEEIGKRLNGEP